MQCHSRSGFARFFLSAGTARVVQGPCKQDNLNFSWKIEVRRRYAKKLRRIHRACHITQYMPRLLLPRRGQASLTRCPSNMGLGHEWLTIDDKAIVNHINGLHSDNSSACILFVSICRMYEDVVNSKNITPERGKRERERAGPRKDHESLSVLHVACFCRFVFSNR
jgi:hypothetical protein